MTAQRLHRRTDAPPHVRLIAELAGIGWRITELRPRRVLEIGCGTGLLLFQLAPRCQRYLAQDFAPAALAHVAAEAARRGLEPWLGELPLAPELEGYVDRERIRHFVTDIDSLPPVLYSQMVMLPASLAAWLKTLK